MGSIALSDWSGFRLGRNAQLVPQPRLYSIAEAWDLPLFDQKLHTRSLAILAVALLPKDRGYCPTQLDCFVRLDQNTEVLGEARCCRKSAADANAKCCAAALRVVHREHADVVYLGVDATHGTSRDSDLEFARKI